MRTYYLNAMVSKVVLPLVLLLALILWPLCSSSSDFVFYCAPWKKINNKKILQNNFSIKINNSSLSILGGDLDTKFFELVYSHPSYYLFSSPSGVLLSMSRDSLSRNITLWENSDNEQLFYSSTCNK
jgi:hypothetical protein